MVSASGSLLASPGLAATSCLLICPTDCAGLPAVQVAQGPCGHSPHCLSLLVPPNQLPPQPLPTPVRRLVV